jgi:Ser/Thr protein kinase RdoA (MazF antagonist)
MNDVDDLYQTYLESRHAAFSTPAQVVFDAVHRATKQTPVSRRKVVKGSDGEIYFVATAQGCEFVVKIDQSGSRLEEEAWALTVSREAGIPAPEVLLITRLEHEETATELMVQSKVPGQPLAELLPRLKAEQRQDVLSQMGQVLTQLHTIRTRGFYKHHADDSWDFRNWTRFMEVAVRDRATERQWVLKAGLSDADFSFILHAIERSGQEFKCDAPALCHGDYLPEHIFVDSALRVCGVIDFGDYEGNHPVHDFAIMRMSGGEALERAVRRGYSSAELFSDSFELRLQLHLLMLQVGYIAHHVQVSNHPEVPMYVQGLLTTMSWLRERG